MQEYTQSTQQICTDSGMGSGMVQGQILLASNDISKPPNHQSSQHINVHLKKGHSECVISMPIRVAMPRDAVGESPTTSVACLQSVARKANITLQKLCLPVWQNHCWGPEQSHICCGPPPRIASASEVGSTTLAARCSCSSCCPGF